VPRSDRHDQGRKRDGSRRAELDADQEREAEREVASPEPERDLRQDRLGNQAVAAALGLQGSVRAPTPALGGDDEGDEARGDEAALPEDGPLTLESLVAGRRSSPSSGSVSVPATDLDPEDPEVLRAAGRAHPVPPTLDAMLQPPPGPLATDLSGWLRQARRWSRDTAAGRAAGALLDPPAACLLDPRGRVLLSRAHTAAIGVLLVLDGDVLRADRSTDTIAFVRCCLDLAAHGPLARAVARQLDARSSVLPLASELLAQHVPEDPGGRAAQDRLPDAAHARLTEVVGVLLGPPNTARHLPQSPRASPPADDDEVDDPLGVDAVLARFTGGAPPADAGAYSAVLEAAERIAIVGLQLRLRSAALGVTICSATKPWGVEPPRALVHMVARQVDRDVGACQDLLLEVATAARRRTVDLGGLQRGLRRATKAMDRAAVGAVDHLVAGVSALIPAHPVLSLDAQAGEDAAAPALVLIDEICAGAAALQTGDTRRALQLGLRHLEVGRAAQNGAVAASGALRAMEVLHAQGRTDAARSVQGEVAGLCAGWGATGALSLLSRWRPG